ncbi:MAG: hypothetical protein WCX95_04945 [Candidatus Gracilibacteria bacterium]
MVEHLIKAQAKTRLEERTRAVLLDVIDDSIPAMARQDVQRAKRLAERTLVDIQEGRNRDLETYFRNKIQALGIDLDEAA